MNDSRIEKLLKAILGQEVQLEPRESRVERLLYAILTGGSHDEPTLSEMEDILLCILNGERYEGPTSSRINALLKVKANGGSYDEPRLSRIEELIYEWINGGDITIYTGTLPATLQTVAGYLAGYKIWGNTVQVGERTGNLFSSSFSANYNINTSGEVIPYTPNSSRCATLTPIIVSNLTTVTFSFTNTSSNDIKQFIYALFDGSTLVSREAFKASGSSINVSQGNKLYLCICSSDANIDSSQTIANIMLNSGSTAIPYEPYGYKLPILSNDTTTDIYIGDNTLNKDEYVDSAGKIYKRTENLFVFPFTDYLYCGGSGQNRTVVDTRYKRASIFKVEPNTTYTFSGKRYGAKDPYGRLFLFDEKPAVGVISTHFYNFRNNSSITFTTEATEVWCMVQNDDYSEIDIDYQMMLNLGSEALPYEPYLTPTDPPAPLPQIPTFAGETTISYGGTGAQPEKVELKYRK